MVISSVWFNRFRILVIGLIAICLLFFVWTLWHFPAYARELPVRILPNANWTAATALSALSGLGWSVDTFVGIRVAFVLITAVFYISLGIFVFIKAQDEWFALLFAFSLVLFGIGTADLPFVLAQWGPVGDRLAYGIAAISYGLPMFLVVLFPDGRFVPDIMRWVGLVAALFILYAGFLIPNPTRPPAPYLSVISSILFTTGVLSQVYRYRVVSTAEQKQQTKWVMWAILLNLTYKLMLTLIYFSPAVNALTSQGMLYSLLRTTTLTLVTATAPVAITFAILRYRLWDIDLIIRKTILYGIMIVGIISLYIFVVGYVGVWLQTDGNNSGLTLFATGIVALLFTPVKDRLERQINRLFFGQRDEPYQLLSQLGKRLETALDPATAIEVTVKEIGVALKLPYVVIELKNGTRVIETAVYGRSQNRVFSFPLTHGGQSIGTLYVATRDPNGDFSSTEQQLLTDLARQISITANSYLLDANLEQARLQLVTERGEARRQLGRDLHDGVGHQLVGLKRRLEYAITNLPIESETSVTELKAIDQQLTSLTKQVRSLAHQLYPPELELLGLVGAIQEQVQTHPSLQIQFFPAVPLPPLSAEIETAVYYITLEAITNIEKHAQAQHCAIYLSLEPATQPRLLRLKIEDDGVGLSNSHQGGVGLLSMQARAAEVGGRCEIVSKKESGTAVIVDIPCVSKVE